ncbi:NAD(P)-binding protein [Daedalea quercina L-15889]|uniref:NAD(P)-binding protein n=1 Tax=Daedalea quercina L-15889 TaxID=1314783 RepID=A0A165LQL4_9APHY|nr:NAD(P)-binding protein [Daedalea quercina L-15889]
MLPTSGLVKKMVSSCKRLNKIVLPLQSLTALKALGRLPVTSLSVSSAYSGDRGGVVDVYPRYRAPVVALLGAYRGSLAELAAPSDAIWECPVDVLQGLTQITIHTAKRLNITRLFDHCARLQSLHIIIEDDMPGTIAALAANPAALPDLTHLKLSMCAPMNMGQDSVGKVASFIRSKKKLRCLDYTLRSLPSLEVLGFDLAYEELTTQAFLDLKRAIPDSLTALRLTFSYDGTEVMNDYSLWAGIPKLAFAHVKDVQLQPFVTTHGLAVAAKSLQLVGCYSDIHEVQRTGNEVTLCQPWSDTKIEFRTVADFGCEDWEQLMRGHELVIATVRSLSKFPNSLKEARGQPLILDLSASDADIRTVGEEAIKIYGRVDVLVNNAGLGVIAPVEELDLDEARMSFQTMVFGALALTQSLLPHFRERFTGFASWGAYGAAKAALDHFSECLSVEVAPFNIRVLIIMPGYFSTDFFQNALSIDKHKHSTVYTDASQGFRTLEEIPKEHVAAGQIGDVEKLSARVFEVVHGVGMAKGLVEGQSGKREWLRVPLGPDCGRNMLRRIQILKESVEAFEPIWNSTDVEPERLQFFPRG